MQQKPGWAAMLDSVLGILNEQKQGKGGEAERVSAYATRLADTNSPLSTSPCASFSFTTR